MISFDAGSNDKDTDVDSLTFAHTIGVGDNRILIVGVRTRSNSTNDICTGVTFNGTPMTKFATYNSGTLHRGWFFYLLNPDTGTHNIVISLSIATTALHATAASYFGVEGIDDEDNDVGSGTTSSLSISNMGGLDWCVGICTHKSGTDVTCDAGDNERAEEWAVTISDDDDGSLGYTFNDDSFVSIGARLVAVLEEQKALFFGCNF